MADEIRARQTSVAIGSCMSNLTASKLNSHYGVSRLFNVAHNRIDALMRYHVHCECEPPPIEQVISLIGEENMDEHLPIIENQYHNYLGLHELRGDVHVPDRGALISHLATHEVDYILCDNFMEQVGKLCSLRSRSAPWFEKQLFIIGHLVRDQAAFMQEFEFTDYIDAELAALHWADFLAYLRILQPNATICFFGFPYMIDRLNASKARRSRQMEEAIWNRVKDMDIIFVPAMNVSREQTEFPEDKLHFKMPVYESLAGMIYALRLAGVKRLRVS